jgi:hypothetical protein
MATKAISQETAFGQIFKNNGGLFKSIEIPMVQRDFAQGRESKDVLRIRNSFLNAIHSALVEDRPVKLDFIYGTITEGKLIPLDGQQRLTTLYLVHWYIAKHENRDPTVYSFLKEFKYRTRFSSQYFCESLVDCSPDFECEKLSEWITDQCWFMYSWEKDPTIRSMLVMLDAIHILFRNTSGIWEKLVDQLNPPISFYFLPLEDMGLTDNLYIKMNSRGKPLTDFEHFKAEFGKTLKDLSPDLYKEFSQKADIEWCDMLWHYRGDDDLIDDEFMRYYRFISEILCYTNNIQIPENDFDLADILYSSKNQYAVTNAKFLFKGFDCWIKAGNIDEFFGACFSKYDYESGKVKLFSDDTNLFRQCCESYSTLITEERRKFTLNNILLLYGIIQYLMNNDKISSLQFTERIRIIRNLVMNSVDEIRKDRLAALLADVESIMNRCEVSQRTLGFNELQKDEEIEKIEWRKNNPSLIEDLNQLEDHSLLRGSISIIGLSDTEKFKEHTEKFLRLFDENSDYLLISNALLTIGDYSQLASWRYIFGNKNWSSWRELFTRSKQRKYFNKTSEILLDLLDVLESDLNAFLYNKVNEYLEYPRTTKDWRFYFIKYPEIRKGSGVFWWRNDQLLKQKLNPYEIIMMNTELSLNGRHWDPFLFTLYSDAHIKEIFTLDEYDSPLILNKDNRRIRCKNNSWELYGPDDVLIRSFEIPQENGIDSVDRIEYFNQNVLPVLSVNE